MVADNTGAAVKAAPAVGWNILAVLSTGSLKNTQPAAGPRSTYVRKRSKEDRRATIPKYRAAPGLLATRQSRLSVSREALQGAEGKRMSRSRAVATPSLSLLDVTNSALSSTSARAFAIAMLMPE